MTWSKKPAIIVGTALFLALAAASAYAGIALRRHAPAATATPETAATPPETPTSRDRTRYADVNQIRIALATYAQDIKTYPDSLAGLVPKYLASSHEDPLTSEPYAYVKNDGGYSLAFSLEQGLFALSAGSHVLTPRGFDAISTAPAPAAPEATSTVTRIPAEGEPTNPLPPPPAEAPASADTDGDGLADDQEPLYGSDPTVVDTDGDGLTDFEEAKAFNSDPANPDTDGDGRLDGAEVAAGDDPAGPGKLPSR